MACDQAREEELCAPAAHAGWAPAGQATRPSPLGHSHCPPPPLCASPARLAAAFLWCYCCQFCREQEQSTVLALKNITDKRTSVKLVNGKNLIWPLPGNRAFHDSFYFTFCVPCLLSALQDCFSSHASFRESFCSSVVLILIYIPHKH